MQLMKTSNRSEGNLIKISRRVPSKQNGRSTSEVKNSVEQAPKPNYHYTQKRDLSQGPGIKDQQQQQQQEPQDKLPEVNRQPVLQPIKYQLNELKKPPKPPLPESIRRPAPLLQQQTNQLKTRLYMYDNPQLKPPLKLQKLQQQEEIKLQLKMTTGALSKAGFDGYQQKTNQDRELSICPIDNKFDEGAFCIMDGHGMEGEKVSQFIVDKIKEYLLRQFRQFDFVKIFSELHNQIKQCQQFQSQFSGSTLTTVLIRENKVVCAWLGDSRAVLCTRNKNKRPLGIEAIDLSNDHKANLEGEKARIEAAGGVVDSYHSMSGAPLGPSRVWVKGTQYPGLAMSRSLGDQVAASVGVSQIPDVTSRDLTQDDLFIIVASDGVWEFISSQAATEMVYPYYLRNDVQGACLRLVQEANNIWKSFDDGIDDITAVIVFLNYEAVPTT